MKNSILFILIGLLTINLLSSQNEVLFSKVTTKEINGQLIYLLNGEKLDGIIYHNHPNNKLKVKFHVKNGLKEGLSKEYYNNGQLKIKTSFINGQQSGLYESYFENGQLHSKYIWQDVSPDGISEEYYENGYLHFKFTWKDGFP
jgi:antitoxin component YwqK of YwqJK toxin-antitoxin module